jgi:glyoxylase-like metal-dependent hydrolase (beta-lactamase superfamily II)
MIKVKNFVFNELEVNSFVLYDESKECVIIDPGCHQEKQRQVLSDFIAQQELKPVLIINTHGHFDHIFGNSWAKSTFKCPVLMHEDDFPLIEHADKYAGIFGFTIEMPPLPDRYVIDGEIVRFGVSELQIIHVPGHSPGSICLYAGQEHLLICGDVLFMGSVGRSDFIGGDHQLLIRGISEKLMILPRETILWPGHGPKTTIGHEYDTNPFLR